MTKSEAIEMFGSVAQIAAALGCTRENIYQWPEILSNRLENQVLGAKVKSEASGKSRSNGAAKPKKRRVSARSL